MNANGKQLTRVTIVALAVGAIAAFLPVPVQGQRKVDSKYGLRVDSARIFEKEGRIDVAEKVLLGLIDSARIGGDSTWYARANFQLGLTYHRRALALGDSVQARPDLERVVKYYEIATKANPALGEGFNNLGFTYSKLGDTSAAETNYRKAISLGDSNQTFYTLNYVDFLLGRGKWKAACRLLAAIARSQPDNPQPHQQCLGLYIKNNSPEISGYLSGLLAAGQVSRAAEAALTALQQNQWTKRIRFELLGIATLAFSRMSYPPESFETSELGSLLQLLQQDSILADPVKNLLLLHQGKELEAKNYQWWVSGWRSAAPRYPNESLKECFRLLCRSLGRRAQFSSKSDVSIAYFRLAASLDHNDPDPLAFADLVEDYVGRGQIDSVLKLSTEFEQSLFMGKGQAYSRGNWKRIYEFHRALGVTYASIGAWTNDNWSPASALFQLRHALQAVELYNAELDGGSGVTRMFVDPRLVHLLAETYENTNKLGSAESTIDSYTKEYLKFDRFDDIDELLALADTSSYGRKLPAKTTEGWRIARAKADSAKVHRKDVGSDYFYASDLLSRVSTNFKLPGDSIRVYFVESNVPTGDAGYSSLTTKEKAQLKSALGKIVEWELRDTTRSGQLQLAGDKVLSSSLAEVSYHRIEGNAVLIRDGQRIDVSFIVSKNDKPWLETFHLIK